MTHDPQRPDNPDAPAPGFPFSPQDALDFMQRMWNPLGIAIPGFAALDPGEIDRKIAELRIVENWLTMSLSMMQMSIKTMELQKASLEAMRGGGAQK
jgi:hypothetical protein